VDRNGKEWLRKCKGCKKRQPIECFLPNKRGKPRTRCVECSHE
jgi:hypothetical protein